MNNNIKMSILIVLSVIFWNVLFLAVGFIIGSIHMFRLIKGLLTSDYRFIAFHLLGIAISCFGILLIIDRWQKAWKRTKELHSKDKGQVKKNKMKKHEN